MQAGNLGGRGRREMDVLTNWPAVQPQSTRNGPNPRMEEDQDQGSTLDPIVELDIVLLTFSGSEETKMSHSPKQSKTGVSPKK